MASPGGGSRVYLAGGREFRKALKDTGTDAPKELRLAYKKVGDIAAERAQSIARSMGGVHAKGAPALKGFGTQRQGGVRVSPTTRTRMANVSFWGAKKRTGWYTPRRYSSSTQQHPDWIGNTWDVGKRGQGPYAINDAISQVSDQILDEFGEAVERLARKAFPD